jgi:phosphohistidine phosphatase
MSCTIYLVRHGIAGPPPAGMSDGDRRLTAEGERKMRRAALGLKRLAVAPDVVLSSPLTRAERTAALVIEALAPDLPLEIYAPLAPGHSAAEILHGLHPYRAARQLMLVGHQPGMGELASHLLTASSQVVPLEFKKGGVAAIGVGGLPPRAAGVLEWLMTPKQLRAIGRAKR